MKDKALLSPLWLEHDKKVRPYHQLHRWLGYGAKLVSLGFVLYWLLSHQSHYWEWWLEGKMPTAYLLWLAYFAVFGLMLKALGLPFDIGHYLVEKKYGLSKQSFGSWAWDLVKGLLVASVIGAMVLGILFVSVKYFPSCWWLIAAVLFFLFSIGLNQLAPVLLIPIFFKLKPMEDGPLKQRLLDLAKAFKVEVKDVYHLGLGEKTEKGNAAFVGVGKTKRIMIGDTLYEKYKPEEVEAVFGHELGHQVHWDLWRLMLLGGVLLFMSFFVADYLTVKYLLGVLFTRLEYPTGMLLFFCVLSLIQVPVGVIQTLFSRSREWQADAFASKKLQFAAPLADALEKLTIQNFGLFKPNPVVEFFTYSHPSPWRRIAKLRETSSTL